MQILRFFPKKHDTIFWYKNINRPQFHLIYEDNIEETVDYKRWNKYIVDGNKIRYGNHPETDSRFEAYLKKYIKQYGIPQQGQVIYEVNGYIIDDVWEDIIALDPKNITERTEFTGGQKPEALLQRIIDSVTKTGDIVLDFFSGSATIAQAVMQTNSENGWHRKFVMIQFPEDLDDTLNTAKGEAKKTIENAIKLCDALEKPHLLTEIGKERIRRAGKKVKEEAGLTAADLDIGFRVLKLDSSNMEDVYYAPDKTSQDDLLSLISNIKPDRTPEDLLFQVMLEFGITLDSKIEETVISGKKVFKVAGNFLIACFDDNVTDDVVKAIAQATPAYAVLRDSSFANDSVAANFEQIFATYSPDTVRRVL